MIDDHMPEEAWQGYAPEDSLAVIKLIATGQQSQQYFNPMHPPVEGLSVVDGPEVLFGDSANIRGVIADTDLLFVSVFLEEPTEMEMAQKILEIAHALEIPTVAIAITPKQSEPGGRATESHQLRALFKAYHGAILAIPMEPTSDNMGNPFGNNEPAGLMTVRAITETITRPGFGGVDYADVWNMMSEEGLARVGFGFAVGDYRAREATDQAISNLKRSRVDLADAKTILINMTAGLDMSVDEFDEVACTVKDLCSDDVPVVVGVPIVPEMDDSIHVTVVATGIVPLR